MATDKGLVLYFSGCARRVASCAAHRSTTQMGVYKWSPRQPQFSCWGLVSPSGGMWIAWFRKISEWHSGDTARGAAGDRILGTPTSLGLTTKGFLCGEAWGQMARGLIATGLSSLHLGSMFERRET